jgi:hypothetical protein
MPLSPIKKKEVLKTNALVNGKPVYFTRGLKNPHASFFVKSGGKKEKILIDNLNNGPAKRTLTTIAKSQTTTPPRGKILNPLTGRYIKNVGTEKKQELLRQAEKKRGKRPIVNNSNEKPPIITNETGTSYYRMPPSSTNIAGPSYSRKLINTYNNKKKSVVSKKNPVIKIKTVNNNSPVKFRPNDFTFKSFGPSIKNSPSFIPSKSIKTITKLSKPPISMSRKNPTSILRSSKTTRINPDSKLKWANNNYKPLSRTRIIKNENKSPSTTYPYTPTKTFSGRTISRSDINNPSKLSLRYASKFHPMHSEIKVLSDKLKHEIRRDKQAEKNFSNIRSSILAEPDSKKRIKLEVKLSNIIKYRKKQEEKIEDLQTLINSKRSKLDAHSKIGHGL